MKKLNTPAAVEKVKRAMEEIELAQTHLGLAAQQLGSLRFGAPACSRTMKQYERVHALWYETRRLIENPNSLSVDSEPEAS